LPSDISAIAEFLLRGDTERKLSLITIPNEHGGAPDRFNPLWQTQGVWVETNYLALMETEFLLQINDPTKANFLHKANNYLNARNQAVSSFFANLYFIGIKKESQYIYDIKKGEIIPENTSGIDLHILRIDLKESIRIKKKFSAYLWEFHSCKSCDA